MKEPVYKLDELARAAGTSPRTVRYYVQRGLLPAPQFRGKDTAYGREHLARLKAIRRLQEAYFPLDAIAAELDRLSVEEIARLGEGEGPVPRAPAPVSDPGARIDKSTAVAAPAARRLSRFEIAPGAELTVADDAPPETRRIVERLLEGLGVK